MRIKMDHKKIVVVAFAGIILIAGTWLIFKFGRPVNDFGVEKFKLELSEWRDVLGLKLEQGFAFVSGITQVELNPDKTEPTVRSKIAVMSDSHGAGENFRRAVSMMKLEEVDFIIHLGDFTEGGEAEYFQEAYEILESSGIKYRVMPGDHDFNWLPNYSRENYERFFGQSYNQLDELDGVGLVLFENSISSTEEDTDWLVKSLDELNDLSQTIFFSPKPLYSPYFSFKEDPNGGRVVQILQDQGVKTVFAGDTHVFARYNNESELTFYTVGAIGRYKNPLPQWVLIELMEDDTLRVTPQPLVDF